MKSKLLPRVVFVVIVLALFASIASAVYFYRQYTIVNREKLAAAQDLNDYLSVASKTVLLPDEVPAAATVSDKSKLQSQAFFKLAENGDKLFIYAKSGLAVLFRPSIKKIIQVASIQVGDNQTPTLDAVQPTPSVQPSPTVTPKPTPKLK